jgi:hydrogenase large subunit
MAKIAIDPITRIEGHLRIEAEIDGGQIKQAWSSGTTFRGIELILKNRDPRDAWVFAQRICGVCTMVHALASVRAVENALQITIPPNARIIRNLIDGAQLVQDHVIQFYHLSALDWVDITSAMKADAAATSTLAQSISDYPKSGASYFKSIRDRLTAIVNSGQLGIFGNGYWGHPAYKLPPEVNLLAVAHYLEALEWQRDFIKIHAILGGKNPHLQTFLVGGMSCPVDLSSESAINAITFSTMKDLITQAEQFIKQVYLPDVLAVASYYPEWTTLGEGLGNFLSYGGIPVQNSVIPGDLGSLFIPSGIILNRDLTKILPMDPRKINEHVTHSWYSYDDESKGMPPTQGITEPNYTGPKPPYDFLNTDGKYSWLKAPRYDEQAMEVGPLARMLVAYGSGHKQVVDWVNQVLNKLNLEPKALFSTLGRIAARCIETVIYSEQMGGWLDELIANVGSGDLRIHDSSRWEPSTWPAEAQGWGFMEAPRGSLGHWIHIKNGKIYNYQAVVPTTWNGSPRDTNGQPGAYEAALVGTTLADPSKPLEILRTIHSFDPCIACAVHLIGPNNPGIKVTLTS